MRDAHLGELWEGASHIVALDAIQRAVGKLGCHEALADDLLRRLDESAAAPSQFRGRLGASLRRAFAEGAQTGDRRRLLLSRLVLERRLAARDPLSKASGEWEGGGDGPARRRPCWPPNVALRP